MAAPDPLYSALYGDATKWPNANPDYAVLLTLVGHEAPAGGVVL